MLTALREIFDRDLARLQEELRLYPSDAAVWQLAPGISNSAGTLALHLIGNLQHFIGATLGHTGYVRDRDSEFGTRGVPREELLAHLDATRAVVRTTLGKLLPARLEEEFPIQVFDRPYRIDHMLIHLATHLGYHLGQVNYHRRLVGSAA